MDKSLDRRSQMPAPLGPLGHSKAVWKETLTADTGKNMTTTAGLNNPFDNDGLAALLAVVGLLIVGWALLMLCYRWVCRRGHGTTESSGASGPVKIPKISFIWPYMGLYPGIATSKIHTELLVPGQI